MGLADDHHQLAESLAVSPATIKITTSNSNLKQGRGTWHGLPIMIDMCSANCPWDAPEHLSHVAKVHLRHLQDLRGAVVPEFFGLYRTDFQALLIYEDVGGFRVDAWSDLDFQERCAKHIFFNFSMMIVPFAYENWTKQPRRVLRCISRPHVWHNLRRPVRGIFTVSCYQNDTKGDTSLLVSGRSSTSMHRVGM
jgi:hypothetical protein